MSEGGRERAREGAKEGGSKGAREGLQRPIPSLLRRVKPFMDE